MLAKTGRPLPPCDSILYRVRERGAWQPPHLKSRDQPTTPAIQDYITMVGPPGIITGTDGALEALLDGLAEVGPEPQRTKF